MIRLSFFLILFASISIFFPFEIKAEEKSFNRLAVADDIYETCRRILFDDTAKSEILYRLGTTPENVCRCSGEYVGRNMNLTEFNFIKTKNSYPQTVFDKIFTGMRLCATITAND